MNPSRRTLLIASVAGALMVGANGLASALKPTKRLAEGAPPLDLDAMMPSRFGEWREEIMSIAQVVNPQQQELLDRIYNQILTRTYVNARGDRVMVSIAYGGDQTDTTQVHEPEACYPAQGFQLRDSRLVSLSTAYGNIPAKRLMATLGQRHEPVTYWIMIGNKAVWPGKDKKLAEMQYGLRGLIPDGLLFRISSIDRNETAAFELQDAFVAQLTTALEPYARQRLVGL